MTKSTQHYLNVGNFWLHIDTSWVTYFFCASEY